MNILFVCKYNHFRSKLAESVFNKSNTNTQNHAQSAGIVGGPLKSKEAKEEIAHIAEEAGLVLTSGKNVLDDDLVAWADSVVIVAADVTLSLPKNKEVLAWDIKDTGLVNLEGRRTVLKSIEYEVSKLIAGIDS